MLLFGCLVFVGFSLCSLSCPKQGMPRSKPEMPRRQIGSGQYRQEPWLLWVGGPEGSWTGPGAASRGCSSKVLQTGGFNDRKRPSRSSGGQKRPVTGPAGAGRGCGREPGLGLPEPPAGRWLTLLSLACGQITRSLPSPSHDILPMCVFIQTLTSCGDASHPAILEPTLGPRFNSINSANTLLQIESHLRYWGSGVQHLL